MGNNAYAVAETEIGAGIESVYGTPVVPTYWFPARQPKYKPDLTMNPDNTLQGSMNEDYDLVPGLRYDSEEWTAFPYMDSFGLLVCALLGSTDTKTSAPTSTTLAAAAAAGATTVSATATIAIGSWIVIGSGETLETHKTTGVSGAGPYTVTLNYPLLFAQASGNAVTGLTQHEFSLLNNAQSTGNQPPSLTINDFDGEEWRAIPACVLDTLTIKGNQTGIAEYTVKFAGNSCHHPVVAHPLVYRPRRGSLVDPPGGDRWDPHQLHRGLGVDVEARGAQHPWVVGHAELFPALPGHLQADAQVHRRGAVGRSRRGGVPQRDSGVA